MGLEKVVFATVTQPQWDHRTDVFRDRDRVVVFTRTGATGASSLSPEKKSTRHLWESLYTCNKKFLGLPKRKVPGLFERRCPNRSRDLPKSTKQLRRAVTDVSFGIGPLYYLPNSRGRTTCAMCASAFMADDL